MLLLGPKPKKQGLPIQLVLVGKDLSARREHIRSQADQH